MIQPNEEHTGEIDCPVCLEIDCPVCLENVHNYLNDFINYLNDFIEKLNNEQLEGMVSMIVAYTGLLSIANEEGLPDDQLLEMIMQMFMVLQANPQMQMIHETMIIEGKLPIGEDHPG